MYRVGAPALSWLFTKHFLSGSWQIEDDGQTLWLCISNVERYQVGSLCHAPHGPCINGLMSEKVVFMVESFPLSVCIVPSSHIPDTVWTELQKQAEPCGKGFSCTVPPGNSSIQIATLIDTIWNRWRVPFTGKEGGFGNVSRFVIRVSA
jgi:hypothetical protein